MSRLRFDGKGAGLGKKRGGDTNSPFDYTLICSCDSELGPLGRFSPNADGDRSAYCLTCKHITVVGKGGEIKAVSPAPKEIVTMMAERQARKSA